jgi:disulfide bond formation protein DsbB
LNRRWVALASLGSLTLLCGAFLFEYIGGLAPCKMCIWQRWPHVIAVCAGVIALLSAARLFVLVGGLSALATALVGFYHAGVEQGWFEGPGTCTSGPIDGISAEDLLNAILEAPVVRCDEIAWSMMGLSMAGWNGVLSLGLAVLWYVAWQRRGV